MLPQFPCIVDDVACAFAYSVPNSEKRVAFTGHEFVTANGSALKVFPVIRLVNSHFDTMLNCPLLCECVHALSPARDDQRWRKPVFVEYGFDVGIVNAPATNYC